MIEMLRTASLATLVMNGAAILYQDAAARGLGLEEPDMSIVWMLGAGAATTIAVSIAALLLYDALRGKRALSNLAAIGCVLVANCSAFAAVALVSLTKTALVMVSGVSFVAGTVVVVRCASWVIGRHADARRSSAARS